MVLGHSALIIQFSRFFFPKRLEIDPPTVTHGKEPLHLNAWSILKQQLLLKHLYILVIWGKKEGRYMIKKYLVFFSIFLFFWLYKGSIFRVLNAFQSEKWCFILSRCFAVSYSNFLPLLCS